VFENMQRISSLVIIAASACILLFSSGKLIGTTIREQPVSGPKAVDRLRHILRINGNRNLDSVVFKHEEHKERIGGEAGCSNCHHVYLPNDIYSPCFHCHSDMKLSTPIFNHSMHQKELGDNNSCLKCHNLDLPKSGKNAINCHECHNENMGMSTPLKGERFSMMAPGYEDSMHELCVTCHQRQALQAGRPELPECDTCHKQVHHEESEWTR